MTTSTFSRVMILLGLVISAEEARSQLEIPVSVQLSPIECKNSRFCHKWSPDLRCIKGYCACPQGTQGKEETPGNFRCVRKDFDSDTFDEGLHHGLSNIPCRMDSDCEGGIDSGLRCDPKWKRCMCSEGQVWQSGDNACYYQDRVSSPSSRVKRSESSNINRWEPLVALGIFLSVLGVAGIILRFCLRRSSDPKEGGPPGFKQQVKNLPNPIQYVDAAAQSASNLVLSLSYPPFKKLHEETGNP